MTSTHPEFDSMVSVSPETFTQALACAAGLLGYVRLAVEDKGTTIVAYLSTQQAIAWIDCTRGARVYYVAPTLA